MSCNVATFQPFTGYHPWQKKQIKNNKCFICGDPAAKSTRFPGRTQTRCQHHVDVHKRYKAAYPK